MNYNRFFIIVFLSAFFNQTHAELPFIYLKDLYNKVSKDYKYLSPVNGFHWWKLGIIENLYRFGNPNDETVKLIRELFYLQPWDNITFDITTLDNKPAKYLTSRSIGKILAFFEANAPTEFNEKNEQEFKESLKQVIKDDLQFSTLINQAQKKKEQHELQLVQLPQRMSEIDAEIKRLAKSKQQTEKFLRYKQKNLEEMAGSGASKEKIAQLTESIASDQNILDSINQKINQVAGYKEKFGELGQMRKKITQEIAKENLTERALDRFIDHLVGCYKESLDSAQQRYPRFTFHQIMLGFLWKKVQQKPEFADYFAAFLNINIPIVAEPDLLSGTIPEWLSAANMYTSSDFEQYKNSFPHEDLVFLIKNYELSSFLMYAYLVLGDFIIPPIINSISNTFYKQYQFPDCVETSIRNLINIAIFDPQNDILDIRVLQKSGELKILQSVVEFYKKNARIDMVDSDILHHEWANILSELTGVEYREENVCNIKSGAQNIFKVVNHLLFGNKPSFDVLSNSEKLDILCKSLSSDATELSWQSSEEIDTSDEFTIEFTLRKNGTISEFTWKITDIHSVIEAKELKNTELGDLPRKLFVAFLEGTMFQITNLFSWIITTEIINKLAKTPQIFEKNALLSFKLLCYSLTLKNNEVKDQLLSILLPLTRHIEQLDALITLLIKSVPQDFYLQQTLLQHLLQAASRFDKFIPPIIDKASNESNKTSFIRMIIAHEKTKKNKLLSDLVERVVQSLSDETNINYIIATIIYSQIREFNTIILKHFNKISLKGNLALFKYGLRIIFSYDSIEKSLQKTISEKLFQIIEQPNLEFSDISEIIELLIPNHNKLPLSDITQRFIRRAQQTLANQIERYIFNKRMVQLIILYKATELYDITADILETMEPLDAWGIINKSILDVFKSEELPAQFIPSIEKIIQNSSDFELLKGIDILLGNNATRFFTKYAQKIMTVTDITTIREVASRIKEKLQTNPSPELEKLYNTVLTRQEELS